MFSNAGANYGEYFSRKDSSFHGQGDKIYSELHSHVLQKYSAPLTEHTGAQKRTQTLLLHAESGNGQRRHTVGSYPANKDDVQCEVNNQSPNNAVADIHPDPGMPQSPSVNKLSCRAVRINIAE